LLAFMIAAIALIALPGPGMLLLLARGIGAGRRTAAVSALGLETSTSVYVIATAAGLTTVLASSALAFSVVRYLGAAYLIGLGVRTLLGHGAVQMEPAQTAPPPGRAYRQAFLIGISNPKIAIFFLAFFPQFVDPHRGSTAVQVLVLGAMFVVMALSVDLAVACVAGQAGTWLQRRPSFVRRQRYVTGSVYLALGASAAASGATRT
jgi:threonine/homoserine/homoserine lactone efflux protein